MELLMPFIDEGKSFTLGFECGQIWEFAQSGRLFKDYLFHTVNTKQIEMILELHGYEFRIEHLDMPWSVLYGTNKAELN